MSHNNNKPRNNKGKSENNKETDYISLYNKEVKTSDILNFKDSEKLSTIISETENFVKNDWGVITSSQLRNIYDKVLRAKTSSELQLIRPQLAYVAARQNNGKAKKLVTFLNDIIKNITSEKETELENFKSYFEAIVGYHKYHHGNK